MNEALYFQKVRDNIDKGAGTYTKVESFAEVALELGYNYPFVQSEVTLDSISADNDKAIWKKLNKYGKVLSKKLPDTIEAETPTFAKHHGFKVNGAAGKEKVRYMPFTITLGDGQVLTALVRNSEDFAKYTPKDDLLVTKWALNAQDITKEVYRGGDNDIDMATTIARLAKIITFAHTKFILKNPIESTGTLAKEIDSMVLDLGNVVYEADKTYAEKIKDMEERKNPTKLNKDKATEFIERYFKEKVHFKKREALANYLLSDDTDDMVDVDNPAPFTHGLKASGAWDDDKPYWSMFETLKEIFLNEDSKNQATPNIPIDEAVAKAVELAQAEVDSGEFRAFALNSEAMKLIEGMKIGDDSLQIPKAYAETLDKGRAKLAEEVLAKQKKDLDWRTEESKRIAQRYTSEKNIDIFDAENPYRVVAELADLFVANNEEANNKIQQAYNDEIDKYLETKKQEPTPSSEDTKTAEELNTKYELEKHDFEVEATVKNGYFELVDIGDKPKLVVGGAKEEVEEYILSHKKAVEEANKPTEEPKPTDAALIAKITEDKVYKQIMKDSHGGVMYNVDNKYDASHLLEIWEQVFDKESQGGIVKGAMNFLKEQSEMENIEPPSKTNFKELTKEFLTLTIDDLEKATEIMTTVSEAIEKDAEDTEAKEEYEKMNKHLDGMIG